MFRIRSKRRTFPNQILVAISGAGGDVGRGVQQCILQVFPRARFLLLGSEASLASRSARDISIVTPYVTETGYSQFLNSTLKRTKPDCFFPTIAGELQTLDDEFFRSLESAGIPVFSNTALISKSHCDKFNTYQIMRSQGVPFARSSLLSEDRDFTEHSDSLVLKPRFGSGGRGVFSLSKQALNACHKQVFSDYLIQDDLSIDREEFTLGVYCPPNSSLTLSCLLLRTLKSGRTWTIRRIVNSRIESCASTVTRQAGALYLNFQGFLGANDYAFFEVNPRLSGSIYFQSPVVNAPAHWVTTKVLGKNLELESFVGEYSGRRFISEEISLYSPTRQ